MALASTAKVILGTVAFSIFWLLVVFPAVPILPIGRTAGSIFGAMLMVVFRVLTPEQAYAAVDLPVLGLLFGTMVVSIYLERADMFKYLGVLFSWKSRGAKDLLCRICIVSALSSALFTNDTICVILTEFILKIARENNLPPQPFLLALASSANIGSSATPIGNPQNLIIAIQSGISFGEFVLGVLPAMLVGVFLNVSILLCMYWRPLSVRKDEEKASHEVISEGDLASHKFLPAVMSPRASPKSHEVISEGDLASHKFLPAVMSPRASPKSQEWKSQSELVKSRSPPMLNSTADISHIVGGPSEGFDCKKSGSRDACEPKKSIISEEEASENGNSQMRDEVEAKGGVGRSMGTRADMESEPQQSCEEKKGWLQQWKKLSWKACVCLITVGMLVAFLMGLNMSWTALTAALTFVVLDFKDAGPCLEKVSYVLLVFFCGMFITVEGFNKTGIPGTIWSLMEPHSRINHAGGIAVLAGVILVLSNIASNVPTVLLLGARVAASAAAISPGEEKKAWLILAWVSTVAGNLSLLGSAANIIVCEQARRAASRYTVSFWSHLKFGLPSTLIITAAGLALIRD